MFYVKTSCFFSVKVDIVGNLLEFVVKPRCEYADIGEAVKDLVKEELGGNGGAGVWTETRSEVGNGVFLETVELCVKHELNQGDDRVHVFPYSKESSESLLYVPLKVFSIRTSSHDVNHFLSEFERRPLKLHVSSWRDVKDESKVNVDEVSFVSDKNVSVVSVLDLEYPGHNRVCCH